MNLDEKYMQRSLLLAQKGLGNVAPNPMVGCVIVHQNNIIGEGYHQLYGKAHAEVNAINSVKNKELLKESILYVNLEPCAHYGKTPPCSDLIIKYKIPKVVIGCIDSFSEVSGKGIEKLKNAGIDVTVGVLEKESLNLNKRFFTFHNKKRPYIILKWAETKDGFMDVERHCEKRSNLIHQKEEITGQARNDVNNWITIPLSKKLVHKWRSEEMGIMVGTNTVINDNPKLNVREWNGKNPTRIVLDLNNRIPENSNVLDNSIATIILTKHPKVNQENIEYCLIEKEKSLLTQILDVLFQHQIQSAIIEGGKQLLETFVSENCWDEARVFVGNKTFEKGLRAPELKVSSYLKENISTDTLYYYLND
ncbi:MAG: bifunctional diaminohydroxyphosphoribosylaminopyrimidine deaminase/5-amino-6-(5-phosphoribosylamino)uracil reductase RibD [Flavobacteriales bacterium]|nr:bifunctional diaminohydroxyphosphoribosylaminopyrimidine deaminase/5-amino-6-(5-phosphoribosylamino)uracil reductase RibD [Flavobacteriales bacterium]